MELQFTAPVWIYPGDAAWHFVTLTKRAAAEVHDVPIVQRRGFGSRRVEVTVGSSTWATSIFPDSSSGSFILPLKQQVRRAERIAAGDRIKVHLRLL
jgi:hypothetical protein